MGPAETAVEIRPPTLWGGVSLRELWHFRDLLYFLVWRDIKVRYKQTALGAFWAILQPFLTMLVFTAFFGRMAKIPSEGVPYPVFAYAALLPWTYFSQAINQISRSLLDSSHLVRKTYFPRILIPLANAVSGLLDLAIASLFVFILMAYYGMPLRNTVFLVLPLFLMTFIVVLGPGLFLAALNVQYRDIRFVMPFLMQVWLFVTPVIYPSSLIPEPWRLIYGLNPMSGVVEGFRWALLGSPLHARMLLVSALTASLWLFAAVLYFRNADKEFADII